MISHQHWAVSRIHDIHHDVIEIGIWAAKCWGRSSQPFNECCASYHATGLPRRWLCWRIQSHQPGDDQGELFSKTLQLPSKLEFNQGECINLIFRLKSHTWRGSRWDSKTIFGSSIDQGEYIGLILKFESPTKDDKFELLKWLSDVTSNWTWWSQIVSSYLWDTESRTQRWWGRDILEGLLMIKFDQWTSSWYSDYHSSSRGTTTACIFELPDWSIRCQSDSCPPFMISL